MYTREQLQKYPYFDREIRENGLDNVLDPLMGIVSRAYILGFAQSLIDAGVPFTFAMLDLDNFKFINDTYGHHVGDDVLACVADRLANYMAGFGVAGRFGGDELILINLRDREYEDKRTFFKGMYGGGAVLRKNVDLADCDPFITGTVGCATYPDDAGDYDGLFELIDKTLYRGKTKGRNCYIIYVKEKHQDIVIRKIARHGVCTSMHSLVRQFELVPGLMNKLRSVTPLLMEELQISDLYYIGPNHKMRSVRTFGPAEYVGDIYDLLSDEWYFSNNLDKVAALCPDFYQALRKREIETLLVVRVGMDLEVDGYLVCAEAHSHRLWQEDECAIVYFLAKLMAARIRIDGEQLDA